jgi:hypothetical protein
MFLGLFMVLSLCAVLCAISTFFVEGLNVHMLQGIGFFGRETVFFMQ